MDISNNTVICGDGNLKELRSRHPDGLTFVVGDTHGEAATLKALIEKIEFDRQKDHMYFVGDYNGSIYVRQLLEVMAEYYEEDYSKPGFHMIRGNHERELCPIYPLENLPDIIVIRGKQLNYYIVHAGMIIPIFNLINSDMEKDSEKKVLSYKLDDICVQYNAPFRQVIWSMYGLYSQKSHWKNWPSEESLIKNRACIIHGHSPYCFFLKDGNITYGDKSLYLKNQHIFFSEDLQSFNIDSNVKGRFENGEGHRGLTCVCIEGIEDTAEKDNGYLTTYGVKNAPSFVFSVDYVDKYFEKENGNISPIIEARPEAKLITMDKNKNPVIAK